MRAAIESASIPYESSHFFLHNVRADDLLAASMRRISPSQEWIIHGFRGKPERLKALLKTGFSISPGPGAPEDIVALIPPERLYRETD